jgi:hypothetical protein
VHRVELSKITALHENLKKWAFYAAFCKRGFGLRIARHHHLCAKTGIIGVRCGNDAPGKPRKSPTPTFPRSPALGNPAKDAGLPHSRSDDDSWQPITQKRTKPAQIAGLFTFWWRTKITRSPTSPFTQQQYLVLFLIVVFMRGKEHFTAVGASFIEEGHLIAPNSLPLRDLARLHHRIVGAACNRAPNTLLPGSTPQATRGRYRRSQGTAKLVE